MAAAVGVGFCTWGLEDPELAMSPVRTAPGPDRIRDERCQIGFGSSAAQLVVSIVQLKESDSLMLCDQKKSQLIYTKNGR